MNNAQLREITIWFNNYVQDFSTDDGQLTAPIQLKNEHSRSVAGNTKQLAKQMNWSPANANGAEALGLLHDSGRFSQFAEFGTYSDANSINHGERGYEVIKQSNILSRLENDEKKAILDGIRHHNAKRLPDNLNELSRQYAMLIRDADKLDIYRIILAAVHKDGFKELPSMLPQINLSGPLSPRVVSSVLDHRFAAITDLRSLSDYLLMLTSWVYDLNYPATLHQVLTRNIIDDLEQLLPSDPRVDQVILKIRNYISPFQDRANAESNFNA